MNSKSVFRAEWPLIFLTILIFLGASVIVSSRKYFWNDEIYSWFFLADPTFPGMWRAFHDKINNTPALYFILGWGWEKIFGDSEVSLRLFSSAGICGALAVTWVTLRKSFSFWAAALGVLSVFGTSSEIFLQNAEARMYGLFLLLASISLFFYDRINRRAEPSWKDTFFLFLTLTAIIHTHIYGLFYSGALLGAQLLRDLYFKKRQPWVYGAIVLSWFSFFLYYPAFVIQADVAIPRGWVPYPTLKELVSLLNLTHSTFMKGYVLVLLLPWPILVFFSRQNNLHHQPEEQENHFQERFSLLAFAVVFGLVPVLTWVLSYLIKPIFWDRYLLPTCLSWCILMAAFIEITIVRQLKRITDEVHFFPRLLTRFTNRYYPLLLIFLFLSVPVRRALSRVKPLPPGTIELKFGYQDLPVAIQYSSHFMALFFYAADRDRYYFILDEEVAADPASGAFSMQEYKHLDAFRRIYPDYFKGHIIDSDEFLRKFPRFLVMGYPIPPRNCPEKPVGGLLKTDWWDDIQCPQWLEKRILPDPRFVTKEIIVDAVISDDDIERLEGVVLVENTAFAD